MYIQTPAFLLLTIASLTSVCHGYWRMNCGVIRTERLDPIINPGTVSGHVHKIAGPSNFNQNSNYASLQNSSCTSCEVQADKSAYWTPQLYYRHSNGSFEEVANDDPVVYYLGRGDNRTNIQPYPPGFRMVSGDSGARSYNTTVMTFGGTTGFTYVNGTRGNGTLTGGHFVPGTTGGGLGGPWYTGRPIADRTSFNCLDVTGPLAETPGFDRTNCSNGLRAQIQFQSCWDGINLYKSDNSHVAYMSQIDNGACPPGYPVQFVHLFFEVLYAVNSITLDGGEFVFAQGDTTGYGFHGDFMNGWDMPTLTAALAQCANTDNGGAISACAPLMTSENPESAWNCPQQPPLVQEKARGMLGTKLPGCITLTSGPGEAPSSDMSCPSTVTPPTIQAVPASTGPQTTIIPVVGLVYNKWEYMGCANEAVNGRALKGSSYVDNNNLTTAACQAFCASNNYPVAGTEYGTQCYCGLSLDPTSALGQQCQPMVCAGNSSDFCGGPSILNIWNSTTYTGPYVPFPSAVGVSLGTSKYLGCVTDAGNPRTLATAGFANSSGVTNDACMAFCASKNLAIWGTEFSSECYCSATIPAQSYFAASNVCTMPCNGNNTQTCGGPNLLTLFNNTAVTPTPAGPPAFTIGTLVNGSTYLGCATEATSGRALNGTSFTSSNMTNAACSTFCASNNYALFGTEFSGECYCSNATAAGSIYQPPQSGCTMPCSGTLPAGSPFANYSNICGGPNRLSLWNNTALTQAPVVPQAITVGAIVNGSTYLGCATEATSGRALNGTSFTASTMTNAACSTFCANNSYSLFGTEFSGECYCSNGLAAGAVYQPSQSGCTMPCSGTLTSGSPFAAYSNICGGPNRLSLWNNPNVNPVAAPTSVGKYTLQGCYAEGNTGRALISASFAAPNMTAEVCVAYCTSKNWAYAGTEFSDECYCGSGISNGGGPATSGCSMVCAGNSKEICGGPNRLNLYKSS